MTGIGDMSKIRSRRAQSQTTNNPLLKNTDKIPPNKVMSAKFSPTQADIIDDIKAMLAGNNSDAIRWCVETAWITHQDRIVELANKKRSIDTLGSGMLQE